MRHFFFGEIVSQPMNNPELRQLLMPSKQKLNDDGSSFIYKSLGAHWWDFTISVLGRLSYEHGRYVKEL